MIDKITAILECPHSGVPHEVHQERRKAAAEIAVEFLEESTDPDAPAILNVVKHMITNGGKCRKALAWLDQRADADGTETGFVPNAEMACMSEMEAALAGGERNLY